jgi:hypothetical protein
MLCTLRCWVRQMLGNAFRNEECTCTGGEGMGTLLTFEDATLGESTTTMACEWVAVEVEGSARGADGAAAPTPAGGAATC